MLNNNVPFAYTSYRKELKIGRISRIARAAAVSKQQQAFQCVDMSRVKGRRSRNVVMPSARIAISTNSSSRTYTRRATSTAFTRQQPTRLQGRRSTTGLAMEQHTLDSQDSPNVPSLYTSFPPIQDLLSSETSDIQCETIQECLPFLAGVGRSFFHFNAHGIPCLEREKHIEYLHERLQDLPPAFVAYDASRPWLLYWTLTGLSLLGADVHQYRSR